MDHVPESPLSPQGLALIENFRSRGVQPVQVEGEPDWNMPVWCFLLWLALPFGLSDFLFGLIIDLNDRAMYGSSSLTYKTVVGLVLAVCLGLFPLQSILLNGYLAFGAERWGLRLLVYCPIVFALSAAGLAGMYVSYEFKGWSVGNLEYENAARLACVMPSIILACQLPFWVMRSFFGWQLARTRSTADFVGMTRSRASLSILHMLLVTAIVAACLGGIRLAPTKTLAASELWTLVGVLSAVGAGTNLIVGIPLIFLFFKITNPWMAWSVALGVPLFLGVLVVGYMSWDYSWAEFTQEMLFGTTMVVAVATTVIVGLGTSFQLLRWHGWTFARVPAAAQA